MATRLIAWREEGIWTWASLYLLEHKDEYMECKTTRNNRVKGQFYKNLYNAYIQRGGCSDSATQARTSRSLRDLISDRGKLCRYISELADMRDQKMDLSWVSKRLLGRLDDLLDIMPDPKQRRGSRTPGEKYNSVQYAHRCRLKQLKREQERQNSAPPCVARQPPVCEGPRVAGPQSAESHWIDSSFIPTPLSYQMVVSLPDGMVLKTSADCKPMLGYDMVGMHFTGTLARSSQKDDTPELLRNFICMQKQKLRYATKMPLVYRRRTSSSTYVWIEAYCRVLRKEIGPKPRTLVCIMERDVTDAVCWGRNSQKANNTGMLLRSAPLPTKLNVPPPIMPQHLSVPPWQRPNLNNAVKQEHPLSSHGRPPTVMLHPAHPHVAAELQRLKSLPSIRVDVPAWTAVKSEPDDRWSSVSPTKPGADSFFAGSGYPSPIINGSSGDESLPRDEIGAPPLSIPSTDDEMVGSRTTSPLSGALLHHHYSQGWSRAQDEPPAKRQKLYNALSAL